MDGYVGTAAIVGACEVVEDGWDRGPYGFVGDGDRGGVSVDADLAGSMTVGGGRC